MARTLPGHPSIPIVAPKQRIWLTWRENLVTLALGLWLMVGLFVDGWAHNNLAELETFFTPWHALFYSGFLANGIWLVWIVMRQLRSGRRGIAALPQGYHLGVIGVFVFGIGGIGDMTWHIIFGIERDIAILLSPTHLLLFLGGSLIFASPFLAAWLDATVSAPRFNQFLPALGSLTLMTTFASFMHMYAWNLLRNNRSMQFEVVDGLQSILITNLILIAPILLMLRRWRIPFGSVTFLFTLNTILMLALEEFRTPSMVVMALIVGLIADFIILILKPAPERPAAYRAVAILIPLVLWSFRFWVPLLLNERIRWPLELTAGITIMAALSGFAVSLLIAPPAIPDILETSRLSEAMDTQKER